MENCDTSSIGCLDGEKARENAAKCERLKLENWLAIIGTNVALRCSFLYVAMWR